MSAAWDGRPGPTKDHSGWVGEELLEALVARVDRPEERDRISGVDHHRQTELARGGEHRREPLLIWHQQLAAAIPKSEP